MKRIITIILSLIIVFSTLFLSGCDFSFKKLIDDVKDVLDIEDEEKPEEPSDEPEKNPSTENLNNYKFEIIENDFYYPTVSGTVQIDFFPDSFVLNFNNEEKTIFPKKVKYQNGYYEFEIDSIIIFGRIKKGEYDYVLFAKTNGQSTKIGETKKINVTKELFGANMIDYETGLGIEAMDAEDNWTKNY